MKLDGLRIGLLTASASRLGGGVAEVVMAQAATIRALGGDARIFALNDAHTGEDRARYGDAPLLTEPVTGPAQIGYAPRLARNLLAARLDCLHLHGIWMYPSRAATLWARQTGKAFLISPHGMLDPWITSRGRWKKAIARAVYERASWRAASAFHALTPRESEDIARETGRRDTLVVANAGPQASGPPSAARGPDFLYLGRIHPKKNIDALLDAWSALHAAGKLGAARLTIAGWGMADHVAQLEARIADAPPSARFVGPAYGAQKARLLQEARYLVLPSLSEGLPMVVLEAWASGTPAIMTSECNLPEGFAAGAAIECGFDAASIAGCLERGLAVTPGQWLAQAQAACALAAGPFSGSAIAARWADAYIALIANNGTAKP